MTQTTPFAGEAPRRRLKPVHDLTRQREKRMSENPTEPTATPEGEKPAEQTFTQADVDRIVRERVQREKAKYADYDDLKSKAAGAQTLEDRVAEIERQAKDSEVRALRAEVANAKGLTASQAKRLIGATRDELEADADELLKDISAQKKQNNVSPREGNNPKASDDPMREFARGLFKQAQSD